MDEYRIHLPFEQRRTKFEPQKEKPIDREKWVDEFCEWIGGAKLNDSHLSKIYTAVGKRLRSATCHVCQKLKVKLGGILVYPGGDLSKPKVFVCEECKEGLL